MRGGGVEEHRLGAGEQGRAFVDLVERIGHRDHGRRARRGVDHRLHEGEQRLARAVHRQHHGSARRADAETALEPGGAGRARLRQARGRRIAVELEGWPQRLDDERRRRMLGFADGHGDMRQRGRRRDAGLQPRESFEGVRGERVEAGRSRGGATVERAATAVAAGASAAASSSGAPDSEAR